MPSKPKTPLFPVMSLLLAATMWGVVWYPLRLLEDRGLAGLWLTAISYGAAMLVGVFILRGRLHELKREPVGLLLIGLSAGYCNAAFILAVLDGVVLRVLLLFYLSPVWTVLLGYFILRERVNRNAGWMLLAAMIGALTMLWEPELGFPWPRDSADWLALSSGFAFALSNVLVRKLQAVSVASKTAVAWAGGVLVALCWVLLIELPPPAVAPEVVAGAVVLGLLGFVVMTFAVQFGVTHMPVYQSAIILLFELVVGAVSAAWLAGEVVSAREWIGGTLIVAAAWLAARNEMRWQV